MRKLYLFAVQDQRRQSDPATNCGDPDNRNRDRDEIILDASSDQVQLREMLRVRSNSRRIPKKTYRPPKARHNPATIAIELVK